MADELRMSAYYYSFGPTGVPEIDKILSAVACAGKAYHHTESWEDECEWDPHTGKSPVEWIQNAANQAAEKLTSLGKGEQWLPVADRLPEINQLVMLCVGGFVLMGRRFERSRWVDLGGEFYARSVTHWMPVPDGPNAQKVPGCPKCAAVRKLGLTSCFEHKQPPDGQSS